MRKLIVLLLLLPLAALADTTTFVCDYKTSFDPETGLQKVTKPFIRTFVIDNDKAYLVGDDGYVDVIAIPGDHGVTFVEVASSGFVLTTTILVSGASVHSRHTVMLGELFASQLYGQCDGVLSELPVSPERVEKEPEPEPQKKSPPPVASSSGMWAVQLGSFSNKENAEKLAADLRKQGYAAFLSQLETGSGQLHRVRIGPQKDRLSAEAMAAKLLIVGHKGQVLPHP